MGLEVSVDTVQHSLRERAAAFFRWVLGRETARQRQQHEELTRADGVIRQTLDPDQAVRHQQMAAPWRAGEEQSLAQRTFDQQGQRTQSTRGAQAFIAEVGAMQQRLREQRQAEQEWQRRGQDRGR